MSPMAEQSDTSVEFEPSRKNWFSFISLLVMQTQNAFNDKAVQFLLICMAGALLHKEGVDNELTQKMQFLLGALIVTPFILLSPIAGWIGDRFPKSTIIRFSSLFQALIFGLLVTAMFFQRLEILVLGFFLLAIQSAVLSPSKLGIIKELVGKRKIGYASGLLEMFTILGILGGTIIMSHWYGARLGTPMSAWEALRWPMYVLLACTPVAILGAFMVEKTTAKAKVPFRTSLLFEHFHQVGNLLKRRNLRLAALAVTYFWIFGGFIQLLSYQIAEQASGKLATGVGPDLANMMLVAGVGIACGSVVASLISKRRIELGLVPVGGTIMALSCFAMAMCSVLSFAFMSWMFVSGLGAAFFLVPVNAYLQDECEESERGNVLAANNLLNCLGGILAVVAQGFMYKSFGFSPETQFVTLGVLSIGATVYATRLLPQQVVRFVALMMVRVVYRIRIEKDSNMPEEGGVLLVPNHVSYIDAFIISAASPRPVRFLMFDEYFKKGWMVWFLRLFNTVPISRNRAKEAIMVAANAVAEGDVVCIFPEGQLTRTGTVNEIKRGFEMITRKANCPVQPVYMDGLWGSIFSFERGEFLYKKPYRLQYGVTVVFGEAIAPEEAQHAVVRSRLIRLGAEAMSLRKSVRNPERLSSLKAKVIEGDEEKVIQAASNFANASLQQQQAWVLNALQITDGPALLRGEVIGIDVKAASTASEVLLHTLPLLNRNRIVVIDESFDKNELCRVISQYEIDVMIGGEELMKDLSATKYEGRFYHLEASESQEDSYSWWIEDGRVVAVNMPDPDAITATQQFQPGSKEGSRGRLLAGYYLEEESIKDGLGHEISFSGETDKVGFVR